MNCFIEDLFIFYPIFRISLMSLVDNKIEPISYKIDLFTDLINFYYSGILKVQLVVNQDFAKNSITFHCLSITIDELKSTLKRGTQSYLPQKMSTNESEETCTLEFDGKPFEFGEIFELTLVFKKHLDEDLKGFYRSKYFVDGKEKCVCL